MSQWPMVKLGDFLTQVDNLVAVTNPEEETFVTVKNHGRGAVKRNISDGKIPQMKSGYRVSAGQYIVSRIDARNGSFAIVPPSLDGAVVSKDFPVFEINETRIDPSYFLEFSRSERLESMVKLLSFGATNRQRIKIPEFLNIQIPLPPLEEQRRIARILKLVDLQRDSVSNVLNATLKELRASFFRQTSSLPETEERRLSEVCELYGGASLPKGEPFDNTKNGLLLMRVSDMNEKGNERHIHSTAMHVPNIPETLPNSIAPAHTVVLPKRGAAIATNKKRLTTRYTMLDPNLIGVHCKTSAVNSIYLYEWFENFDLTTITSGSSIPQLNKKDLNPLLIPIPSTTALKDFTVANSKIADIEQYFQSKLELLEELHQSLATRAFAGQL